MKLIQYLLFFLICIYVPNKINAQLKNFKHITTFNKFQPKTFNKLLLDHKGILWIATDIGLFKYDSKNFYRYSSEQGLPDNEVLDIHTDIDNNVWISTFSNQIAFVRNDTAFSQSTMPTMKWPNFSNSKSFVRITSSKFGGVYAFSFYNNSFFHVTTNSCIEYRTPLNEGINEIIECGTKDSLMVYTKTKRILMIQGKPKYIQTINYENSPFLKPIYMDGELLEFKYQHNENRITKINLKNQCKEQILNRIKLGSSLNIMHLINDTIFMFVSNKIYAYSKLDKNFQLRDSLPNQVKVNSMVYDLMNNKIIEATNDGLFIFSKSGSFNYSNIDPVYNGNIKIIEHINNKFFLYINKTLYVTNSLKESPTALYTTENEVKSIIPLSNNKVLIFLALESYLIYDFNTLKIIKSGSFYSAVKQAFKCNDSIVCLASSGLTLLFNLNRNKIDTVLYPYRSTSVACDSSFILIGTLSGLYKYDRTVKKLYKVNELNQTKISCLTVDPNSHTFFIGTTTNGLFIYKPGKPIQHKSMADKLISNEIVSLKVRDNTLILNSNKGGQYFRMNNDSSNSFELLTTLNNDEGLGTNNINDIEIKDNRFYIGLKDGLISMDFITNKEDNKIPIQIASIEVNGHFYSNSNQLIVLSPKENYIKIHYNSLGYMLNSHRYKYRLVGIDQQWQSSDDDYKEYGPLPPGSYEFVLMAINNEGLQQSKQERLKFVIEPTFYQEKWVQVTGAILLLAALFFMAYLWNTSNRKKEETKRHVLELELQGIRSQINPHFIFNSLASIQSFINNNKIIESNLFISKFAKLIRSTLELSKQASISLQDELDYIQTYLYLQQIRFQDKFNYSIHVEDAVQPNMINIPPLITQLYIENAIVHGLRGRENQGQLEIKIYKENQQLIIQIDDNGIGRVEAMKRKDLYKESRGLSINKERIDKYNSLYKTNICIEIIDKYDALKNAEGTTVKIVLPYVESRNN